MNAIMVLEVETMEDYRDKAEDQYDVRITCSH